MKSSHGVSVISFGSAVIGGEGGVEEWMVVPASRTVSRSPNDPINCITYVSQLLADSDSKRRRNSGARQTFLPSPPPT